MTPIARPDRRTGAAPRREGATRRTGRRPGAAVVAVVLGVALLVVPWSGTASATPLAAGPDALTRPVLPGLVAAPGVDGDTDPDVDPGTDLGSETDPGVEGGETGTEGDTGVDPGTDTATDTEILDDPSTTGADDSIVENQLGARPDEQQGSSAAEDRKIWAVIGGLLLVAVALTILTVRYWRQTRPAPRPGSGSSSTGRRARTGSEPSDLDDLGSDLFVDER